jgi:thiol-disulfide isomerase/thioredoxin
MKMITLLACCLELTLRICTAEPTPPDKESLVVSLRAHEANLSSARAEYRYMRWKTVDTEPYVFGKYTWHTANGMHRIEGVNRKGTPATIIHNKKQITRITGRAADDNLGVMIHESTSDLMVRRPPCCLYCLYHGGFIILSDVIDKHPLHEPISEVTVRGTNLTKISVVYEPPDNPNTKRFRPQQGRILNVLLDPAKGFAPIEWEVVNFNLGYVHNAVRKITYNKSGNVWIPSSGVIENNYIEDILPADGLSKEQASELLKDATPQELLAFCQRSTYIIKPLGDDAAEAIIIDRMKVGPVDSSLFEAVIPTGARVYDAILDISYTAENEDEKRKAIQERDLLNSIIGIPAPSITANEWINSQDIATTNFIGQPVIIDFFSTNCGPCRRDYPALSKLHSSRASNGVIILGIHTPITEKAALNELIKEFELDYPIAIDSGTKIPGYWGETFAAYKVNSIPCAILLDQDGKVVARGGLNEILGKMASLLKADEVQE